MSALALLDYASVLIFALTGALVASRAQLDIVGFAFMASITALGGGTFRDVVLDRNPVFWIGNPTYLFIALAAALLIYFTAHLVESRYRWLLWLDSFALAVAVPAGMAAAMTMLQPAPVLVIMGVATGCLGGLLRDVVCNELPLVLKQGELYVTAALGGALAGLAAIQITHLTMPVLVTVALTTWALRAGSLAFGWRLPVYKSRPKRQ